MYEYSIPAFFVNINIYYNINKYVKKILHYANIDQTNYEQCKITNHLCAHTLIHILL